MTGKSLSTKLVCSKPSGIYKLRYKTPGNPKWVQISLNTTDKAEADRKRQQFIDNHVPEAEDRIAMLEAQIARLKADKIQDHAQTALNIENVWNVFMGSTDRDPISAATLPGYVTIWEGRTGLKPWMKKKGIHTLADFTSEHAGAYIRYLEASKISRQTAGKYVTFLRRLWDTVAPDLESPWKRKKPQGSGSKIGKKPFTVEHQRAIIQYVDPYFDTIDARGLPMSERDQAKIEYKALHIIMAYTGLRLVDACQLTIEEVFFDRGVIETIPKKTRNRGTNPMYAKIGIHPTLGIVLRTLLKGRSSGFFLPYIAAEYDRDKSSISKRIQKQIHGATKLECNVKLPGRGRAVAVYGAHSHRKALEDRMREGGVHMVIAYQIMGHVDNASMMQTYSHVSDKEVVDAIKASMPDLLIKPNEQEMAG